MVLGLDKKRDIDKFRTAIWCNFVFRYLGISDPKQFDEASRKTIENGNIESSDCDLSNNLDKLFSDPEKKAIVIKYFHGTNVSWQRYFYGKQAVKNKQVIDDIELIVPGSKSLYSHGPHYLFNMMEERDAKKGWKILEKAILDYFKNSGSSKFMGRSINPHYKHKHQVIDLIGDFSQEEKFEYVTHEGIKHFFLGDWDSTYKNFDYILPYIEPLSYHQLNKKEHRDIVFLEVLFSYFIVKFTTDEFRFNWLGGLLFKELHVGLVFQQRNNFNLPIEVWFNSSIFRRTAKIELFCNNIFDEEIVVINEQLKNYEKKESKKLMQAELTEAKRKERQVKDNEIQEKRNKFSHMFLRPQTRTF